MGILYPYMCAPSPGSATVVDLPTLILNISEPPTILCRHVPFEKRFVFVSDLPCCFIRGKVI